MSYMKLKLLKEKHVKLLEHIGVVMRVLVFGTLSIMGPNTPFLWMLVGIVGIYTSIFGNAFTH